eukprot:scaffold25531_cov34-Tisochrysis_lutea.AAC.2
MKTERMPICRLPDEGVSPPPVRAAVARSKHFSPPSPTSSAPLTAVSARIARSNVESSIMTRSAWCALSLL